MPISDCESAKQTAFFLEGETEILAFRQHFGIRAKKIGLYGHNVDMEQIARKVGVSLLTEEIGRAFIMFDRESRPTSSSKLANDLRSLLAKAHPDVEVVIAIPDRDFECWLFADTEVLSRHFKKRIGRKAQFEGEKGADKIKSYVGNGAYDKTDDGVKLVGKVSWSRIAERSPSARSAGIEEFFSDCNWLGR